MAVTVLARGAGNKQIARTLDTSEKTVRNHVPGIYKRSHIYDRWGLSSTPSERVSWTLSGGTSAER